jgi:hypothetical protein
MTQANLFDTPLIPGLAYEEEFVAPDEEAMLIREMDALPLSPFRFQGWTGKRLTLSLGWTYDFDNSRFGPSDPIPSWLAPIKTRASRFAGVADADLVQALLIRYDPGAGIGWHRDRPVFDHVVGIPWERPPRCASAGARPRASTVLPSQHRRGPSIIFQARRGMNGNMASPRWKHAVGPSPSAHSPQRGWHWLKSCKSNPLSCRNGHPYSDHRQQRKGGGLMSHCRMPVTATTKSLTSATGVRLF